MSATVQAALASNLAAVTRLRDAPEAPFGYGTDIDCAEDFHPLARDVRGDTLEALGQALYRRLITPRGSNPDDADYGYDVASHLNRGVTTAEVRGVESRVRLEVEADDRVRSAVVTLSTEDELSEAWDLRISVTPYDQAIGAFSLTLALTDGAALLEEIRTDG